MDIEIVSFRYLPTLQPIITFERAGISFLISVQPPMTLGSNRLSPCYSIKSCISTTSRYAAAIPFDTEEQGRIAGP